jgi:hypothetical protein
MSNYNPSVKSRGILAFANNTAEIDYETMAQKTLSLASRSLGIQHKLITNQQAESWFNYRLDTDSQTPVPWNNHSRWQAYNMSPWDETIVIDADYLVLTDRLNLLFESTVDYLLCFDNFMLNTPTVDLVPLEPVWATVFFFRKTNKSKLLFDTVARIERNYTYYRHLFGVKEQNFRNDYAFSMADLIINGHERNPAHRMPWGIISADAPVLGIDINKDWLVVREANRADILPRTDLHVMSKNWFFTKSFDQLLEQA